ncbi:Chromatin-remodeling complex ATPase chain Iswi [Gryllus bimaculatus]|nr:Chromatin-remodeling complex ATPase chain Iswi [Gryllus bimaculatus]
MSVQLKSNKKSSYKRKRDESQNEENSVLKELSVNIKKGSPMLTPHETSAIHLSKDDENHIVRTTPSVGIKRISPESLVPHDTSALHVPKDDKNNVLNDTPSLCENEVCDKPFYVIKKSESDDSVLTESEVLNGTSFTEEDSSSKEVEDSVKINKKSKTVVKPSLSLEEKLTYLKKLMAISNAYSKYVSKNLAKASNGEQTTKNVGHLSGSQGKSGTSISSDSKTQINNCKEMESTGKGYAAKFSPPPLFTGTLKEYQKDGCEWLKILFENASSGILADEMGLGKTVQTIAIITHLISKNLKGPFLVVAPLSTLPNWISEFKRFCPTVPVILFHGNSDERKKMMKLFRLKSLQTVGGEVKVYPVIVTSYNIILMEPRFFGSYKWLYLVVDEGHRLKNKDCKLTRLLTSFSSSNRLLLTGTPLQNNLEELWSLLRFLTPEIFGNIEDLELLISSEDMQSETIVEQEIKEGIVSKLHAALQPFILRRMKKDVNLMLPPKKEILVYAPMSQTQWELYNATLDGSIFSILGLQEDEILEESSKRKSTLNPRYILDDVENDDDLDDDDLLNVIRRTTRVVSDSKKKKAPPLDKDGNRCYVNLKMQNPHFQLRKICNHPYLNPQVDLQAQDRCHRIGQTRPVVVYRFVTKASIDEKIVQYAQNKRRLEKLVLHNDCYKGLHAQKPENFVSVEQLKALLHSSDYSKVVRTSGNAQANVDIPFVPSSDV